MYSAGFAIHSHCQTLRLHPYFQKLKMVSSYVSSTLRARARHEQDNRRRRQETYTTSLRVNPDMKDFLKQFYCHVYTPVKQRYYKTQRAEYPEVDSFYKNLVEKTKQVRFEDFWQRYEYRCNDINRIALELWRQDQQGSAQDTLWDEEKSVPEESAPHIEPEERQPSPTVDVTSRSLQEILNDARRRIEAAELESQTRLRQHAAKRFAVKEDQSPPSPAGDRPSVDHLVAGRLVRVANWRRRLEELAKEVTADREPVETQTSQDEEVTMVCEGETRPVTSGENSQTALSWKYRMESARAIHNNVSNDIEDCPSDEARFTVTVSENPSNHEIDISEVNSHDAQDEVASDEAEGIEVDSNKSAGDEAQSREVAITGAERDEVEESPIALAEAVPQIADPTTSVTTETQKSVGDSMETKLESVVDKSSAFVDEIEAHVSKAEETQQSQMVEQEVSDNSCMSSDDAETMVASFRGERSIENLETVTIPTMVDEVCVSPWTVSADAPSSHDIVGIMVDLRTEARDDSSAYVDDKTDSKDDCKCQTPCSLM